MEYIRIFLTDLYGQTLVKALDFVLMFYPVWLPIALFAAFWHVWLTYIRARTIANQKFILLEIKLPKDIFKPPSAMELVFTQLWQTSVPYFFQTWVQGKIRPWFSLELVSIEGEVKFFIWTDTKYKDVVEASLYSQYPGIEIYEASDYTTSVHHDPVNFPFWASYFKLSEPDAYPIKTYIDYKLDENPKEEFKVDPMTSMLEYLGSMKKGEQAWVQILITAHRKETLKDGVFFVKPDWKDGIKKELQKIYDSLKLPGTTFGRFPTKMETEKLEALQRSMSKLPFACAIRGFYIATKDTFDVVGITGLIGSLRQYSSMTLNRFGVGWYTDTDQAPWLDFHRMRRNRMEKQMLEAYKRRSIFFAPYRHFHQKPFILTTEELATIFHLPGAVATTPTLARIPSKKGQPPPNLPV